MQTQRLRNGLPRLRLRDFPRVCHELQNQITAARARVVGEEPASKLGPRINPASVADSCTFSLPTGCQN